MTRNTTELKLTVPMASIRICMEPRGGLDGGLDVILSPIANHKGKCRRASQVKMIKMEHRMSARIMNNSCKLRNSVCTVFRMYIKIPRTT